MTTTSRAAANDTHPEDLPEAWTGTATVTDAWISDGECSLRVRPVGTDQHYMVRLVQDQETTARSDGQAALAAQVKLANDGAARLTALSRTSRGARRVTINSRRLVELVTSGVRTTVVRER